MQGMLTVESRILGMFSQCLKMQFIGKFTVSGDFIYKSG